MLPNGNFLTVSSLRGLAELRRVYNYPYDKSTSTSKKNWEPHKLYYQGASGHCNGTAMYFPKYDKYFYGCGSFYIHYPEDLFLKANMGNKHGSGTSIYYQSSNRGAYSPDYDQVLTTSYWRQNTTTTYQYYYLIDIPSQVYRSALIPDLSTYTGIKYMPMITYSHYSKKFYGLVTGGTADFGQGRIYIYDISTWITNGKTDMNDISIGQIDLTSGYRSAPHPDHFDYSFVVQAGNWIDIIE